MVCIVELLSIWIMKTCFICKKYIYTCLIRTQFMRVLESFLRSQWYLFRSIEPLIFNGWVMWMYWFCSWWYVTGGTQRLREDMIHAFDIFNKFYWLPYSDIWATLNRTLISSDQNKVKYVLLECIQICSGNDNNTIVIKESSKSYICIPP